MARRRAGSGQLTRLRQDARGGGLARAARADEQEAVAQAIQFGPRCGASRRPPPGRPSGRRSGRASGDRWARCGAGLGILGHSSTWRARGRKQAKRLPCTLRRPATLPCPRGDRLGPGRSAAPGEQRLALLPSGPDVVHESPLRGTRSSTSLTPAASANAGLGREFSPAGADCRYRAPLVPRLARPADDSRRVSAEARADGRRGTGGGRQWPESASGPRGAARSGVSGLGFGILPRGEVSEWLMVPLSKSGVRKHRGFESRPLRHRLTVRAPDPCVEHLRSSLTGARARSLRCSALAFGSNAQPGQAGHAVRCSGPLLPYGV